MNLVWFQRYVFGGIRTFESRSKRFSNRCAKCNVLARFLKHFVRMNLVCKIWAKKGGIFQSHLHGSQKHIELGAIRGFDFRLAIEVKFDWYSFNKPCLVSAKCILEFSNVRTSFQTAQYWMYEMRRISAVSHLFVRMTLVCKIRPDNGNIFPSHLDGS
jgi:hypothetical protein